MTANPHHAHTGEHLAQQCLIEAAADYTLALALVLEQPATERRDHAVAALALWASLATIANDNDDAALGERL